MFYDIDFIEKIEIQRSKESLERAEMEIKPIDILVSYDKFKKKFSCSVDLPNSKYDLLESDIRCVLHKQYDLTQGDVFLVALDRKRFFEKKIESRRELINLYLNRHI